MTLQEKIQKKAEGFGKLAPVFLEGANFALENQWISVKDDLPCNHKELLEDYNYETVAVIVKYKYSNSPSSDIVVYSLDSTFNTESQALHTAL